MTKSRKIRLKLSSRFSDHLIQAILIFASVFLAFWLTDYRDSQNKSETLNISLQHIASEMEYNHKRIEAVFDYHTKLIEQIDSINDSELENLHGFQLKEWRGMQLPMLRSTAYQTFLNSGINDKANFELAKSLADIYNIQSVIERLDNSFFETATTDRDYTDISKVRYMLGIYSEILPNVIKHYQEGKKTWLHEYGYDIEVTNERLKRIVESQ